MLPENAEVKIKRKASKTKKELRKYNFVFKCSCEHGRKKKLVIIKKVNLVRSQISINYFGGGINDRLINSEKIGTDRKKIVAYADGHWSYA